MPSAEIISIGTEILLGEIVDTNTRYIARTLRGLGIDLYRTTAIGDNAERIAAAIRESMQRAAIVITTGGLGPTVDDPTREAAARAAGIELEFREELWKQITAAIARYGRNPTENQKRQAYIPKGALAIHNPVGTAPAFIIETKRNAIICLPGVPKEMEHLLHTSIIPYLQSRFDLNEIIKVRLLRTSGMGEGMIDEHVAEFESLSNPTVGLAAHNGVVDIRIAAKAQTESQADAMIANIESQIRDRLGNIIFGVDNDTLEGVTLAAVKKRGWTLTMIGSGLTDSILRNLPPFASLADLEPAALTPSLRAARTESGAHAALGVAVFTDEMKAEIAVITPHGEDTRVLSYGGHPRNLPRWAMNTGLHLLRRQAETKP